MKKRVLQVSIYAACLTVSVSSTASAFGFYFHTLGKTASGPGQAVAFTWDASHANPSGAISNSGKTWTDPGGAFNFGARGNVSHSSGKYYFEVVQTSAGQNLEIGIANSSWNSTGVNNYLGSDANSAASVAGYSPNLYIYSGANFGTGTPGVTGVTGVTGDTIGVAFDAGTGNIWWSVNNVWLGSGNPGAGTNAQLTLATGSVYYPAISSLGTHSGTINSTLTYAPPSGFSPW